MKTAFFFGDPYKQLNKNYRYHGMNWQCEKPPKPDPFDEEEIPTECYVVFTLHAENSTPETVLLHGKHWIFCPGKTFTWRGFEYWGEGDGFYNMVFEFGEFESEEYSMLVTYPA